jgi:hypothetical protein
MPMKNVIKIVTALEQTTRRSRTFKKKASGTRRNRIKIFSFNAKWW